MPRQAFFGPPRDTFVAGGAHITVYLVPVFEGRLVVFDVDEAAARGRWLPWDVLPFGGNPYECASALADDWCGVSVDDLALVDAMSFAAPDDGWELALVFRALLLELPPGDGVRSPYVFKPGEYDAIGPFDPIDLERWVTSAASDTTPPGATPERRNLLF
jgi:hypothetical protein